MSWPKDMAVGAALAATLADDAALRAAGPALWTHAAAAARRHAELSEAPDRRAALRALARRARPTASVDAVLPPRARAVIAARVPKEVGRIWLRDAPPARRSYRPARGVVEAVVRGAEAAKASSAARDRGVGRALLAASARSATDDDRQKLLAGIGAEEAAAVLALAALEDEAKAPSGVLLDAAAWVRGDARVDALGALARGAREPSKRHRADPLARAGRELMELGLLEES